MERPGLPGREEQIARIQSGGKPPGREAKFVDIYHEKPIRLTVRALVPVKEHPKFNFVGKLLGPKGNSMKRLQEETMTKMAVLGRGSMRNKQQEEELRNSSDPKYSHLADDLHVEITAFAPPSEAHARVAYALTEVRKYLIPDSNDEIRQLQMREMELMQQQLQEQGAEQGQAKQNEEEHEQGPSSLLACHHHTEQAGSNATNNNNIGHMIAMRGVINNNGNSNLKSSHSHNGNRANGGTCYHKAGHGSANGVGATASSGKAKVLSILDKIRGGFGASQQGEKFPSFRSSMTSNQSYNSSPNLQLKMNQMPCSENGGNPSDDFDDSGSSTGSSGSAGSPNNNITTNTTTHSNNGSNPGFGKVLTCSQRNRHNRVQLSPYGRSK